MGIEKYLYLFEDGSVTERESINDNDINELKDGYVQIFKFEDGHFYEMTRDSASWKRVD